MSLIDLPHDLWVEIDSYIDAADLPALCQTCRHLLDLLEPRAYSGTLTIKEDATSCRRVLALSRGPRARTLRRLNYVPTDPKPIRDTEHDGYKGGATHDPSVKLSDETAEVLRSLAKFPNLETVNVILSDWVNDWAGMSGCFSFDFNEYHRSEDEEPWRALLAGSFRALAQSRGAVPKLRIVGLPPSPQYPIFETEAWRDFLRSDGLRSLEIVLEGQEDLGAGNLTVNQEEFVEKIPEWFLVHAKGLEELILRGHDDAYIGHYCVGEPIAWPLVTMPKLRTFELVCTYANDVLGDFLARHAATLETVRLERCLGVCFPAWEGLLEPLVAVPAEHHIKLVEFSVEGYDNWDDDDSECPDAVDRCLTIGETCESYGEIQLECDERRQEMEEDERLEVERQKAPVVQLWNTLQARVVNNRVQAGLPALPDASFPATD